jgi:hypothetical protein
MFKFLILDIILIYKKLTKEIETDILIWKLHL